MAKLTMVDSPDALYWQAIAMYQQCMIKCGECLKPSGHVCEKMEKKQAF